MVKNGFSQQDWSLAVFDYSEALNEDDRLIIEAVKASGVPALAIVNKTDLNQKIDEQNIRNNFKQIVYTNSADVTSLERVTDAVESLLQLHQVDLSDGMIANERQRLCALEAQAALKEALAYDAFWHDAGCSQCDDLTRQSTHCCS